MTSRPFVADHVDDVDAAGRVARSVASRFGLDDPTLVRVGTNALFTAGPSTVIRVGRFTAPARAAADLATVLSGAGLRVPIVREAIDDVDAGLSAVVVDRIVPVDRPVDWSQVGDAVRRVHGLERRSIAQVHPLPPCTVYRHWHFTDLFDEIAPDLGDVERRAVAAAVERLSDWPSMAAAAPTVVCHGDVHPGNVLVAGEGTVLLDWDMVCTGPAAWDHAALLTWEQRWGGAPGLYAAFASGYGADLSGDPLATTLAEGRLLAATLMRCRAGRHDATAAAEARRRLRYWVGDPDAPVWHAA